MITRALLCKFQIILLLNLFAPTHLWGEELYTQMVFLIGRFWLIDIFVESWDYYHKRAQFFILVFTGNYKGWSFKNSRRNSVAFLDIFRTLYFLTKILSILLQFVKIADNNVIGFTFSIKKACRLVLSCSYKLYNPQFYANSINLTSAVTTIEKNASGNFASYRKIRE